MKRLHVTGLIVGAALLAAVGGSQAQQPSSPPQFPNMTFFITSTGGPSTQALGGPTEINAAENGRLIPSRLYTVNQHDILTGSKPDGAAFRRTRT